MTIRDYLQYPHGRYKPEENREVVTKIPIEYARDYPRNFTHAIYNVDGIVIFLVHIPSRRKEKLTYDVAIAVMGTEADAKTEPGFLNFKAFSNSPSFYFRHARTFRAHGAYIEFLAGKYDSKVWETPPKKSEMPTELTYERTVYLALYHLQKQRLLSFAYDNLIRKAKPISKKSFAAKIKSTAVQDEIASKSHDTTQEAVRKNNIAERKELRNAGQNKELPSEVHIKKVGNTRKFTHSATTGRFQKSGKVKKTAKF